MNLAKLPSARVFQGAERVNIGNNIDTITTVIDVETDLWNELEYYSETTEVGIELVKRRLPHVVDHMRIFKEFQALVRQAKSYYSSAKALHYRSSSLLYYYSFLSLAKALIT